MMVQEMVGIVLSCSVNVKECEHYVLIIGEMEKKLS